MSGWGPGPAENDDAADWLDDFVDAPEVDTLRDTFSDITDADDAAYFELPESNDAVIAAFVLAEALDRALATSTIEDFPLTELREAVSALKPAEQQQLIDKAVAAVQIVMNESDNSELRQIWEADDDESFQEWLGVMSQLADRLRGSTPLANA